MQGYLALVLHAHLPFVRHPEHDRFLEETWLFEAVTETYVPLLRLLDAWDRDGLAARLTLSLSPTLAAMLCDPLLQERYTRHLDGLIELVEKERHRTRWDPALHPLAEFYHDRFQCIRQTWRACHGDLVAALRRCQDRGQIEISACAATHALLPLLADHPPSVRGQVLVARDHYRRCFGRDARGIWLPECAYADPVGPVLQAANLRWFVLDSHGLLRATPRPRYGGFAPVFTPDGIAAFGRDLESAQQVWSRQVGYPGDPRYRDFYRDIGFDLEWEYVKPYLPASDRRTFTGIKYHRITGQRAAKQPYDRALALAAAVDHAAHFLAARRHQLHRLAAAMDRPPLIVSPYDAELFGHWWYEGPEFLDALVRRACAEPETFELITPGAYLSRHPTLQVARPSPSSWGEEGYWRVWLDETNQWIYPHLQVAQEQMTELARNHPQAEGLAARALKQAARELLLAQASDWAFILHTGTDIQYARTRVTDHLLRFRTLHDQLTGRPLDAAGLAQLEAQDNVFPDIDYRYWA